MKVMSLGRLYLMLTKWHMRLPYWQVMVIMVIFAALALMLLIIWKKKKKYNRLFEAVDEKCKRLKGEKADVVLKCRIKDEEIARLNDVIVTVTEEIERMDCTVNSLNGKVAEQEISIDEIKNKYLASESEKTEFLLTLHAKESETEELKNSMALIKGEFKKIKKERERLVARLKNTREKLAQKKEEFDDLYEKYTQLKNQHKAFDDAKKLLEKELDDLKSDIIEQEKVYKAEIKNLNSGIDTRDEHITKLNIELEIIKKELQIIQENRALLEKTLQDMQEKNNKSKNFFEKIAKW